MAIIFPRMIFDQWSFVDLFANVPTKFFLWIQTNNWLSTYLHELKRTDTRLEGSYQMNRQGPGGLVSGHSLIEISERQWQDSASSNIRLNFVTKLQVVLLWESGEKKPGSGMQHWISSLLATGWCPAQLKSGADTVEGKRWHHLLVVRRQGWIIRVGFGRSRSPKTSNIVVCNILKYGQTNCWIDLSLKIARFPCNFVLQKRDWLVRMQVGNLVWPGTNRRQGFLQLSVH